MKANWKLVASDITAALTLVSMIPYDKDTMDLIGHVIGVSWTPFIIKAGIIATLVLRLWDRYFPHLKSVTTTPAGAEIPASSQPPKP